MASDESKRKRIMEFSFKQFTSMGIPHVTMDEISRGVGIGKGTLYKFFPSKEELIYATIDHIAAGVQKQIDEIMAKDMISPAEKLSILLETIAKRLAKVNPAVFTYLEKSIPEAYDRIAEVRKRVILTNIMKLIEDGKKSGQFEPGTDALLTAHILIGASNHIMDEAVLTSFDYSLENIFRAITSTILKGCLTEEGRKQAGI